MAENRATHALGERILTRLEELGLSQAALARKIGVTPTAVNLWVKGSTSNLKAETLIAAARALQVRPSWLSSGIGEKELNPELKGDAVAVIEELADPLNDYVIIPEYCLDFSAGGGAIAENECPDCVPAAYKLSWMQSIGLNPKNARRFRVRGDSMEPTLSNNDRILVDISQNLPERIQDGAVYAVRYGESLKVKRLRRRIDGRIVLISDNPAYPEEEVLPEYAHDFAIIGRVLERSSVSGL